MKKFIVLVLVLAFTLSVYSQGSISSLTVSPASPTVNDTVLVIAGLSFTSGACPLDYKEHSLIEHKILATTHHCLGALAVICGAVDTFRIDPLAAGTYTFNLILTSGGLPIPCTPGIVIDDQDSVSFTVSPVTTVQEYPLPVRIMENPVHGTLRFTTPLPGRATIFSITGQSVLAVEAGETEVSIAVLRPGLYFIRMNGASGMLVIN